MNNTINIQHIYKQEDYDCGVNRTVFQRLAKEFPVNLEEIPVSDDKAKKLINKYNLNVLPATIVDGQVFAVGKVDEAKLRGLIKIKMGQD